MSQSIEYVQKLSNFNSAYNATANQIHESIMHVPPLPSSVSSSLLSNRPSSPLFRRCASPRSRPTVSSWSGPKFNFDLYQMGSSDNKDVDDDSLLSFHLLSPSSARKVSDYSTYPRSTSLLSESQKLSTLEQINNELCETLAQLDAVDPPPMHYHIHHHPISERRSYRNHHYRSASRDLSPSSEAEILPKTHRAPVIYRVHMPPEQTREPPRRTTESNVTRFNDDPTIIDLYPTRDGGFVKQVGKTSTDSSPWVVSGKSVRQSSYSDLNTSELSETPKGPCYGDKPIKSRRQSARCRECQSSTSDHRSSSRRSRHNHSSTAAVKVRDRHQESNASISDQDSIQHRNYKANHRHKSSLKTTQSKNKASQTSDDLTHKTKSTHSADVSDESSSYRRPTTPKEHHNTTGTTDKARSDQTQRQEKDSNHKENDTNDGRNLHSTQKPTVNSITRSPVEESKPTKPHNTEKSPLTTESPKGPVESPARNRSKTSEQNEPSESKSQTPPLPQPASTSDKATTDKTSNYIHNENQQSVPAVDRIKDKKPTDQNTDKSSNHTNEHPAQPPSNGLSAGHKKPLSKLLDSDDDEGDEDDREVASNFDFGKWLGDATKDIMSTASKGQVVKPTPIVPQPKVKSPRRKEPTPPKSPETSESDIYLPPFGPKRKGQVPQPAPEKKPPSPVPTTQNSNADNDADDFFS